MKEAEKRQVGWLVQGGDKKLYKLTAGPMLIMLPISCRLDFTTLHMSFIINTNNKGSRFESYDIPHLLICIRCMQQTGPFFEVKR